MLSPRALQMIMDMQKKRPPDMDLVRTIQQDSLKEIPFVIRAQYINYYNTWRIKNKNAMERVALL
jgi:hypothetical protein